MVYRLLINGIFVRKVNRFVCEVAVEGDIALVHIKTTGRLAELLCKGANVLVEPAEDVARKTKYSLIAVKGRSGWVNVDSQLPNKVMWEALKSGVIEPFGELTTVCKEVKRGNSRFDLYYERGNIRGFVEVKGVTYAENDGAKFPDAPSERARKHVAELMQVAAGGDEATVVFVVQVPGCSYVAPYEEMDPQFAKILRQAALAGVRLLAYEVEMVNCAVTIVCELPVQL